MKIITEDFRVQTSRELYSTLESKNADIVLNFESSLTDYSNTAALGLSNTNIDTIVGFVNTELSVSYPKNNYYAMASSYDSNTVIDNTQKQKREFQRRVIFGSKIETSNIRYMFENTLWTSNTIYDSFDDTRDNADTNGVVTILDGDPGEGPYKVFKCIRNNLGAESVNAPSVANLDTNNETTLADGYVWKYMFDVPASEYLEFATQTLLPYVANNAVSNTANETVSDIIIESAIVNQFSDYIIGSANSVSDSIESSTIESVVENTGVTNSYIINVKTAVAARTSPGAYIGMYLRIIDPGQAKVIYDIDNTIVDVNFPNRISVYVTSTTDLTTVVPSLADKLCDIVPKITVSNSSGTRCIAYGELNKTGTLKNIHFVDKGTEYKYATSAVSLPAGIDNGAPYTELRTIVSPIGGHGFNPVTELLMSKLAVVSNFLGDATEIPNNGTYTKVGLVKNPNFTDLSFPVSFDNRILITSNTDMTGYSATEGYYLVQEVGEETVTSLIHEIVYDSNTGISDIYVVDYNNETVSTYQTGTTAEIKSSLSATETETITINTVGTENYIAYSGELLHYIDFDKVTRQADRKEKVKFIFDF